MIQIDKYIVSSTDGKMVHRIGSDVYFKRSTTLDGDTEADFEEVDAVPGYTRAEYNAEVERLIAERYTMGQEIQYAREGDVATGYAEYLAYVEACKARAKVTLVERNQGGDDFAPDVDDVSEAGTPQTSRLSEGSRLCEL